MKSSFWIQINLAPVVAAGRLLCLRVEVVGVFHLDLCGHAVHAIGRGGRLLGFPASGISSDGLLGGSG